ncbi:hypothetical protein BGZ65_007463 [Modicella reniformis]|uniref:Uncharacterized protein n=1 Tax=Modicella reniformis TaxID=1440133 RepID=A0A9P6M7P3_9FUNG|nr:hypothetical protein BGZ65_007463 [Modicella reniformis]
MTRYNGTLKNIVNYICAIPSDILYLTQQALITFKILPSSFTVRVVSAVIKLKQYTRLDVRSGSKSDTKELLHVLLKDGWPVPEAHKSWQRTIVVPFPGAPELTPMIRTEMITKTHKLKLIMQVKVGPRNDKHELRVESGHQASRILASTSIGIYLVLT